MKSFWSPPLVLLVDEAQVEARLGLFGDSANPRLIPFGDSANLDTR
jgi:hypothetical protein